MRTYGYDVTKDQYIEATEFMRTQKEFTCSKLEQKLMELRVPRMNSIANRIADKLIQQHRKSGKIEQIRRSVWAWVK